MITERFLTGEADTSLRVSTKSKEIQWHQQKIRLKLISFFQLLTKIFKDLGPRFTSIKKDIYATAICFICFLNVFILQTGLKIYYFTVFDQVTKIKNKFKWRVEINFQNKYFQLTIHRGNKVWHILDKNSKTVNHKKTIHIV